MKISVVKTAFLMLGLALVFPAFSQYPFYFSSGNFNPPNSWTQGNAVRMGSIANTNIQTDTATAIGNCYFRFFSDLSGGTIYEPNGTSDVQVALNTPFNLQVSGGNGKAFYFPTVNFTDNYIFKTTGTGAPGNTRAAVIRVQGPVQWITDVARFPAGNVYAGQDVAVSATLSGAFNTGQGAYLRFTTDNWSSSTVIPMAGQGTEYSAVIPGAVNTTGARLNYYVFTSGDGLTIAPDDADLMTINLFNNNFANFTYVPQCPFTLGNPQFELTETDKARYNPGEVVNFSASFTGNIALAFLHVTYWHLGDTTNSAVYRINNATSFDWTWQPPNANYCGYMASLRLYNAIGQLLDSSGIAVDVSSDWKRYPRYGFLSAYPWTDSVNSGLLLNSLNRYHLNELQFYDVNYEHNKPLAGSVAQPDTLWHDIANRLTYLSTVRNYISRAHACNMMAMNYNLLYGAYTNTAVADGVLPQWGIYYDQNHQTQVGYNLPASWASNLQVENPADTAWQHYLFNNEKDLFAALPFDGWHVDQLGSQGNVYDYSGNPVNLAASFGSYLQNAAAALHVPLVMNGVTNYGQQQIATAPVEFLYTEVWPPFTTYNSLAAVIDSNRLYSSNTLSTVLAAYMDRGISDTLGMFNTPGVLLTEATIFAAGGDHIELGEHLLGNEYFPNNNLSMSCDLQQQMIKYYDFMVAYENLLRDSVSPSTVSLQTNGNTALSSSAATGKIWVMSKSKTNTQIFQLINLVNANTLNWNDPANNQTVPNVLQNLPLSFTSNQTLPVKKIYCVSPDWNNGLPVPIVFQETGQSVSFSLPAIKYWSTIVVEYGTVINSVADAGPGISVKAYPNPFGGQVNFSFQLAVTGRATISLTDEVGRVVAQMNKSINSASEIITVPFESKPQGIYFWLVVITDAGDKEVAVQRGKLVHL